MSSQTLRKNTLATLFGTVAFVVMLGPWGGLLACFIKDFLFLFVGGGNIFGVVSDFIATSLFALPAGMMIRKDNTARGSLAGFSTGAVIAALAMIPVNLGVLYLEFGMPPHKVMGMMLPVILPFNLLKCVLNSVIYQLLGRPVIRAISKYIAQ